jgi:ComF family protein
MQDLATLAGTGGGAGRFARLLRAGVRTAIDLVLPPTCLSCRNPVATAGGLCSACWGGHGLHRAPLLRPARCDRLGTPFVSDDGDATLSPAAIADPPAYDRARAAAHWMARAGRELLTDADALVPVPLHWSRLWQRRFNQSAMLARAISARTNVPVADDILVRTRATAPQVGLARKERARNVQGAFAVENPARIRVKGRKLIVIDDVLTSGATVDACARVLRRAGATRVDVLVLARVVNFD